MELAREILLRLEANEDPNKVLRLENEIEGYSEQQIYYHTKLLAQAGLIEAMDASSARRLCWVATSLTMDGHEFLDAIRNDTVWNNTKEVVKEKGGSIPFEILKELAIQTARGMFGL